jgi:GSH-dependent disulfide-bond oxidoreductase
MLDLFAAGTPNGKKITIFLEEAGLAYALHKIDLGKGEQRTPEFLAKSPNGKIPALVDSDAAGEPVTVFESGAILIYLAEKCGKFLSTEPHARAQTLAWLMFQMSAVGPMMGQAYFFQRAKNAEGIARFDGEVRRIFGVLEGQLATHEYLAGEYSIADMATYPWVSDSAMVGVDVPKEFPHIKAWLDRVAARPGVRKGVAAL